MKLSDFPHHVQQRILKDNPVLRPVGKVEGKVPQCAPPRKSLESSAPKRKTRKGRVECRVTLVVTSKRQLDDDNLTAACKPLRDAIARDIGIDDGDTRCQWEYGQCLTRGEEGVLVKIQLL